MTHEIKYDIPTFENLTFNLKIMINTIQCLTMYKKI